MTTGHQAFEGRTHSQCDGGNYEKKAPSLAAHRPVTPPAFDRAVKVCFAKDTDDRWQSARDLGLELKPISENPGGDDDEYL